MKCPCRGCEDRKLGCHGVCTKYEDWKIERQCKLDWLREQEAPHRETIRKRETQRLRREARGWDRKR